MMNDVGFEIPTPTMNTHQSTAIMSAITKETTP